MGTGSTREPGAVTVRSAWPQIVSPPEAQRSASTRTDWQSDCVGEARRVSWGALTVRFHRDGPDADGVLASYAYGSIVPGRADARAGFATVRDIRIGTTIDELRTVDDVAEIHTGYDGFVAANWTARGSEIVATLDRDFLDAGATVVRIASPRTATLQVC